MAVQIIMLFILSLCLVELQLLVQLFGESSKCMVSVWCSCKVPVAILNTCLVLRFGGGW
jgi:hypothetical protein